MATSVKAHFGHPRLPPFESKFYCSLWVFVSLLPIILSFSLSQIYYKDLADGTVEVGIFSTTLDVTDAEWMIYRESVASLVLIMFLHSVIGRVFSAKFPDIKTLYYLTFGILYSIYLLSVNGFFFLFGLMTIAYGFFHLKSVTLNWILMLVFIFVLNNEYYRKIFLDWFHIHSLYEDSILVVGLMTCLRLISFSHETITQSCTFTNYLCYMFYLPLFLNGPILTYDLFIKDFYFPRNKNYRQVFIEFIRCLLIGFGIDLYFHFSCVNNLSYHHVIIKEFTPLEAITVGWPLIVMFCMKYKVIYGISGVFVKIDGIEPPGQPKCVCSLYTFIDMWRYFDKGLYRLLQRSVYFPIGGSKKGVLRMIIASFCCFSLVAIWHGNEKNFWCWALMNWLGIIVENFVAVFLKNGHPNFKKSIGEINYRRVTAAGGSVSIIMLIYSNLVFVTSLQTANLIYKQIFSSWIAPLLIYISFYMSVHVSIDFN